MEQQPITLGVEYRVLKLAMLLLQSKKICKDYTIKKLVDLPVGELKK
jgi:hypothetical protein